MLDGEDLVLLSDGRATRTFCYVADAVVGYVKILVNGQPGEPYNIGTESPEVSMRDLAERVATLGSELFGYRGNVSHHTSDDRAYLTDNPNRRCPDITKARTLLGWEPKVKLEQGLVKTIDYFKRKMGVS